MVDTHPHDPGSPRRDVPTSSAGRLVRAARGVRFGERAKQAAAALRAEYEAGKRGDDAPPAPIWPSAKDQAQAVLALLHRPDRSQPPAVDRDVERDAEADTEADQISTALAAIEWTGVDEAAGATDVRAAIRRLAEQVDWRTVQPVAARVSSALIAAVAAGRIPVGGPLGPVIARAIVDQGGLAERVGERFARTDRTMPPDYRHVIDATSRDAP